MFILNKYISIEKNILFSIITVSIYYNIQMYPIYIEEINVLARTNSCFQIGSELDLFIRRKMYIDIFQTAANMKFCLNTYLNIMSK